MREYYEMRNRKRLARMIAETEEEITDIEHKVKTHKCEYDSFFFVITDLLLKQLYEKKNRYQYQMSLLD